MRHLNFLDGLRAISILMVLGFHGFGPISGLLPAGWLGVDIFFVISGFLITSLLLREKVETGTVNYRNFYIRRFLRLMPAYWSFLAVSGFLYWSATPHMATALAMAGCYMSDYDIALNWGNVLGSGLEITWSLSIEEKFYLLWPALVGLFGFRSRRCAIVSILLCELFKAYLVLTHATVAQPYRILGGFDTHVDELMFGCLAGHLFVDQRYSQFVKRASTNVVSLLVLAVIVALWATTPYPTSITKVWEQVAYNTLRIPSITALSAVLILLGASNEKLWVSKVLSFPPLRWVGRLSYSLYLWHGVVMWQTEITGFGHRITHNIYKRELLNFGLALAAASTSYYLIEMPFLRLKKRFSFHPLPGESVEQDTIAREPDKIAVGV